MQTVCNRPTLDFIFLAGHRHDDNEHKVSASGDNANDNEQEVGSELSEEEENSD